MEDGDLPRQAASRRGGGTFGGMLADSSCEYDRLSPFEGGQIRPYALASPVAKDLQRQLRLGIRAGEEHTRVGGTGKPLEPRFLIQHLLQIAQGATLSQQMKQ